MPVGKERETVPLITPPPPGRLNRAGRLSGTGGGQYDDCGLLDGQRKVYRELLIKQQVEPDGDALVYLDVGVNRGLAQSKESRIQVAQQRLDQAGLEGQDSPEGRHTHHEQRNDQDEVDDKREDDGDVLEGIPGAL